jgi:Helicase HerA, central domain
MLDAERSRQQEQSPPVAAHAPTGRVISVRGSQASIGLSTSPLHDRSTVRATVGKFLGIFSGESLLIAVITKVIESSSPGHEHGWLSTADVDLVGEIKQFAGSAQFQRGVTDYPAIGDPVLPIGARELRLVYNVASASAVAIGHLQQDSTIAAYVDIDDTLCKHFAVLGTTGVGKSSAVVLMLQEFVRARPNLRILILDAHNEYGRPFGEQAFVLNPRNLKLPFWLRVC